MQPQLYSGHGRIMLNGKRESRATRISRYTGTRTKRESRAAKTHIQVHGRNAKAALQTYVAMILPQHFFHAPHETTNPNVAYHKKRDCAASNTEA